MSYQPFISATSKIKEISFLPIFMGSVLGIIFGASSLYLALKVGMTVSASIPIAVLSITIFKAFSKIFGLRTTTILENNIVQTTGSAGESIAFGVAVTMPALLILGYDMELNRIMTVAVLGGLLGVLMMIPLRKALIVKEHGNLIYPEGTACAEVLIAGQKGGEIGKIVFGGFFVGLLYKLFNVGFKFWKDVPEKIFTHFKGASISAEISPELLGVGYIIGIRTAAIMIAGGVLSSFVLIPMISLFGGALIEPLFPGKILIKDMTIHDIWRNYVLYIGAGAVAAGGIISLFKSLPMIVSGAKDGFASLKTHSKDHGSGLEVLRTDQDLPLKFVLIGCFVMLLALWLTPSLHLNLFSAFLILVFGFLFVTVSSRLTGQIGSSSNPISGMTVATLLLTCLLFVLVGWVGLEYRVTALSVAAVVCIAASNGGTTSQDLKTGFLVGATPKFQQIGLFIGVITSALVIGYTLELLNNSSTIYSKNIPNYQIANFDSKTAIQERVGGSEYSSDTNTYFVYHVTDHSDNQEIESLGVGKYLVNDQGNVQYLVDPGINGRLNKTDSGSSVQKYEAPKARLMSLIIDGILTQKLPWSLVLLGVFIALVLELCGIASLPFAVGVYLPISASMPIFVGGLVRYLVERKKMSHEVGSDTGRGVLFSSGLIAGGSIAGIILALLQLNSGLSQSIDFSSSMKIISQSDLAATIVFLILAVVLYRIGRKAEI